MQELTNSCVQELMSTNLFKIQIINWSNSFKRSFRKSTDTDLVINLSSHSFHNKNYKGENLIQIPFLHNLKSGVSRELYQSIIQKNDGFNLSVIKTYTGKQSFIIKNFVLYLFHHSYLKSYNSILNKIPELLKLSVATYFRETEFKSTWDNQYPKTIPIIKYKSILALRFLIHILKIFFTYDHWKIAVCNFSIQEICRNKELLLNIKSIASPANKDFIADPFGFQSGGHDYIIYERFDRIKNKGILEIRKDDFKKPIKKIEKTEHLSYPYIYEEEGKIFMIPECHQSGEINLYKWAKESEEFDFECKLIEGFNGIDNSILKHNGKYWIFSNNANNKSADIMLNIFFADKINGPYQSHPQNPIITSITHSRSAGTIFQNGEVLIRPSQNSGITYGGSIQLNQIITITETEYFEKTIDQITANDLKNKYIKGIHTISVLGDKTIIDYKYKRLKIGSIRF